MSRRPSTWSWSTVLAVGVLLGFALGWVAYRSPWSTDPAPPVLYDQKQVTSLYEDASRAVVEVKVLRASNGSLARSRLREDSGSGFIVDDAGHIVTNDHVVRDVEKISVRLFDGRELPATRLGTSPADDLALLQVDRAEIAGIDPLPLADSDKVEPGQLAIAIGNPFRQTNSITVGVVSGTGRSQLSILMRPIPDLIQTDAALNPGNSGGPLLNDDGAVIGVNSSVRIVSAVQIGVGFAVPSNTLKSILPSLLSPGEIRRPWIGIISPQSARRLGEQQALLADAGIYVSQVCEGSPAHRAGLRGDTRVVPTGGGDVITAVDGISAASMDSMVSYLNSLMPGDPVTLTILRDSEALQVDLTLAEWGSCERVAVRGR